MHKHAMGEDSGAFECPLEHLIGTEGDLGEGLGGCDCPQCLRKHLSKDFEWACSNTKQHDKCRGNINLH